jgi:DNA-directed RNA polymerase sigma subunit (sigma70/sigma32)
MECNTHSENKFIHILKEANLLRGIHYVFIGNIISDFEKVSNDSECIACRKKYEVFVLPMGEINALKKLFESARAVQEAVEKPFYKKVIAMAIGISNNNPEFIADNFMEGARGLRKAIWRFNIFNGGVLAGFIDIWINNELLLFQPCNLIKVPTGLNALHNKVMDGLEKGKTFAQSAKEAGMTEKRAKDIELMLNKEADVRIDVAVGNGVSDDNENDSEEVLDENLIVGFDEDVRDETLLSMLLNMKLEDRKMICLHYGLFDMLMEQRKDITKEDVLKEIKRQNQKL